MVLYLSEGDPIRAAKLKKTSEQLVFDYYYQNRVTDLNKLLDHIAYLRHLKEINKNK